MSYFNYITKSNSDPKGKPKVYFCCHPDDFSEYFDEISKDIFKHCDCVILFDKENTQFVTEEMCLDFEDVRLFVVPISARLLKSTCRAKVYDIPFALKNHIPILPLMQETGLEDSFNASFGDIQFLDKNRIDSTSLDFDLKLKKYLDSVLIGKELTERIQAAFDAYIFLSYRKKDRKYAKELMRLIHEKDFCRDIAIWYDEFLTPGENFNDAIEKAMRGCQVFALTVTPNLVNEDNYISRIEYPMASSIGMPILPAMVCNTDRHSLERKFIGIPSCADANDSASLANALRDTLRSVACRANDRDPIHNYLIGIAYLEGIDVEINASRAYEMILSSANAGLDEAQHKLAEMYRYGNGVEYNREMAVQWLEKYKNSLNEKFERTSNDDDAIKYIRAMQELGELFEELHRFEDAYSAYKAAYKVANDLILKKNAKPEHNILVAECDVYLAGVAIKLGYKIRALLYSAESVIYGYPNGEGDECDDIDFKRRLLECAMIVLDTMDDFKSREIDFINQGLSLAKSMLEETKSDYDRQIYIRYCIKAAEICIKKNDIERAKELTKTAENLFFQASFDDSDIRMKLILSKIYINYADIDDTEIEKKKEYANKVIAITSSGVGDILDFQIIAKKAYMVLHKVSCELKNESDAMMYFHSAYHLAETLVERSGNVKYYEELFFLRYLEENGRVFEVDESDIIPILRFSENEFKKLLKTMPGNKQFRKKIKACKKARMVLGLIMFFTGHFQKKDENR